MIFKNRRKKKVIRNIKMLQLSLRQRYGGAAPWTEGQIKTTVEYLKLKPDYLYIAFVLFGNEQEFENIEGGSLLREKGIKLLSVGGYRHYFGADTLEDFECSTDYQYDCGGGSDGGGGDGGSGGD